MLKTLDQIQVVLEVVVMEIDMVSITYPYNNWFNVFAKPLFLSSIVYFLKPSQVVVYLTTLQREGNFLDLNI